MEKCKACECKTKSKKRDEVELRSLTNRLSRIEGQVRGIRGMLEADAYCIDIMTQVGAVISALNSFNRELLASHVRTCVADDIRSGGDEAVSELVDTLARLMK